MQRINKFSFDTSTLSLGDQGSGIELSTIQNWILTKSDNDYVYDNSDYKVEIKFYLFSISF